MVSKSSNPAAAQSFGIWTGNKNKDGGLIPKHKQLKALRPVEGPAAWRCTRRCSPHPCPSSVHIHMSDAQWKIGGGGRVRLENTHLPPSTRPSLCKLPETHKIRTRQRRDQTIQAPCSQGNRLEAPVTHNCRTGSLVPATAAGMLGALSGWRQMRGTRA